MVCNIVNVPEVIVLFDLHAVMQKNAACVFCESFGQCAAEPEAVRCPTVQDRSRREPMHFRCRAQVCKENQYISMQSNAGCNSMQQAEKPINSDAMPDTIQCSSSAKKEDQPKISMQTSVRKRYMFKLPEKKFAFGFWGIYLLQQAIRSPTESDESTQ